MSQTAKPTLTKGRGCQGKLRHDTKDSAEAQRSRLIKRGAFAKSISAYHCPHCDGWHVGHKAGSARRR